MPKVRRHVLCAQTPSRETHLRARSSMWRDRTSLSSLVIANEVIHQEVDNIPAPITAAVCWAILEVLQGKLRSMRKGGEES